uniref:Acetoacetyl-synthetase n=1 Tax=Moniliophthora roreri TaxID=221103 RepID=A0A0W0G8L3_MONRR
MSNPSMPSTIIWRPAEPAFTAVEAFRRAVNRKHNLSLKDYRDLHHYSVNNDTFWMDLWEHVGITYSRPPDKVSTPGRSAHQLEWFPGAHLNYAENLLQRYDDRIACSALSEIGRVIDYSYLQLRQLVQSMTAAMKAHGLLSGDRVAILTNSIEAIVIFLATASIGAIYTSTAPDMGTTGTPKCIVHSAGGILLQVKKELAYGYGMSPEGTYFQYTTTGWMMWVLMMGTLSWGARVILYDGSPFHPDIQTFLKMISDQGTTVAGLSPKFLSEMRAKGIKPHDIASFETLQSLAVGGSILTANLHAWTQQVFGKSTRVFIGMGGTDICSAFVLSSPSLPIYAGEISCKSLGIKVEVYDNEGRNIEHTGQAGEMVVTKGHPTVPLFFWGDESGGKFHDTYFSTFPDVWRQGDFVVVNPETGGIQVLGRSDGVLNPKGIRFGSGEIYSILERIPRTSECIEDTICVGQRRLQDSDERVVLFVKMRSGYILTKAMRNRIRTAIRQHLSARHVPKFIVEVESIPYTTNGKKMEVAVKQIVSGTRLKPSGAVANPESLEQYYKYQQDSELSRASDTKL